MICLVLGGPTSAANRAQIERHRARIDLAELRVDLLDEQARSDAAAFSRTCGLPLILTVRRRSDGGRWSGGEEERLELMRSLLAAGRFAWVDLEEDLPRELLAGAAGRAGTGLIRSLHDFEGVPLDLADRLRRAAENPEDLPKAAVMPTSSRHLLALVRVCLELTGMRKIVLGMGAYGTATRILCRRLGSFLTFAAAGAEGPAPGQLDPETLETLYGYRRIGERTKILAVVGNPIQHSRSPHIHNAGYRELGLDCVYVPFLADDIDAFLETAALLGLAGISVTVPFKEEVVARLSSVDATVAAIGACNTLVPHRGERAQAAGGALSGYAGFNTDVEGFLEPLRSLLGPRRGLRASVVGAGGAARAVVYALLREGAEVLVVNRRPARARAMLDALAPEVPGAEVRTAALDEQGAREAAGYSDLVVQTTPVGMHPLEDEDPFPQYRFAGHELVYDLIYNPRPTRFLRRAAAAGCTVLSGERMLLHQAYEQFRFFTGREFPRRALEPGLLRLF